MIEQIKIIFFIAGIEEVFSELSSQNVSTSTRLNVHSELNNDISFWKNTNMKAETVRHIRSVKNGSLGRMKT